MAVTLDTLPPLAETLKRHGIRAQKSYGQHFLFDENITGRVAREAGRLEDINVIEIGPGPGGLTRSLLKAGAQHIYAIEKDSSCLGALEELRDASAGRLTIIHGDALEIDVTMLCDSPRKIVANLPYNVATPLLFRWLDCVSHTPLAIERMTLMFQREVAERIAATPGGKDYGRLAVMSQWLCEVTYGFDLPPGAFHPPPKVHSAVISLMPMQRPRYPAQRDVLEKVVATAFNQRRKMLRGALKNVGGEALCIKAGVDPQARAETLSVKQFCDLANAL